MEGAVEKCHYCRGTRLARALRVPQLDPAATKASDPFLPLPRVEVIVPCPGCGPSFTSQDLRFLKSLRISL